MDSHYDTWLSNLDLLSQSNLKHILIYPAIPLMIYHFTYSLILGSGFYKSISSCNICHLAIFLLLFQYTMEKYFSKYTKYTGTVVCFCVNFACFAHALNLSPESAKYFVICSSVITLRSDFIIYSTRLIGNVMKITMLILWYYMDYLNGTFTLQSLLNTILPTLFILWVGYYSDSNRDKIFRMIYNYQQSSEIEKFKLGKLLKSIPDSLVVIENDFRIELVNDYFREAFEVCETKEVQDLFKYFTYCEARRMYPYNQESLTFYEDVIHFMNSGLSDSVLFGTVKYKDKYFEWRGSKTRWSSSNSTILISREVTSIIHLEISRSESKYKTAMLRSVSHELRTPTGAITSLSENMLEIPNLPEKVRSDLEIVRVCAKLLLNLINDLLDYSQLITGTFSVCKRHFEFRPFLEECSSLLKVQCNTRRLDVITFIDPNIPEVIYSDPDRLRQIILNLVSNSIK